MNFDDLGKWVVVAGVALIFVGGLMWLLGRIPLFGNLPGDIHIQTQNMSCFIPLASMIIVSVVATIILDLIIRIVNK